MGKNAQTSHIKKRLPIGLTERSAPAMIKTTTSSINSNSALKKRSMGDLL